MGTFKRSSQILSAALVAVSLAVTGCGASPDSEPVATAQQGVQKYRGVVGKMSAALDAVELRADQRAVVDGLLQDVDTKAAPVRAARDALAAAVMEDIRGGKVDRAKVDPHLESLKKASLAFLPTIEVALNKLHATLDASQREDLVDALRDQMQSAREGRRGGMKAIAEELKLTDEQREQIFSAIKSGREGGRKEMRERFKEGRGRAKEIADAFVSDTFDARSLGLGDKAQKWAGFGAERVLRVADTALPILTAEQRSKLADIVKSRLDGLE